MERIIKGQKRYNTDTAKKRAVYEDGNGSAWYRETLYRKKSGEYFLHGEGQEFSKYSKSVNGLWTASEEIIPLTYDEAQKWAKKHLTKGEYNGLFGVITPKEGKYPCHLMLPKATAEKLRRAASKENRQQAEIITELIEKYL